ncbi:hypothetical protein, partial [Pseudomonas sp. MWU12-2115]|uniref:hypothetical protein n=1 Tax=Pseudomonas sp. MWU12-2115 TaxID=2071713 RepID=UPI001C4993C1
MPGKAEHVIDKIRPIEKGSNQSSSWIVKKSSCQPETPQRGGKTARELALRRRLVYPWPFFRKPGNTRWTTLPISTAALAAL